MVLCSVSLGRSITQRKVHRLKNEAADVDNGRFRMPCYSDGLSFLEEQQLSSILRSQMIRSAAEQGHFDSCLNATHSRGFSGGLQTDRSMSN